MDLEKAIECVRACGTDFEKARLSHTLGEKFDSKEVLDGFSAVQNPDGGFPYADRKGFPSCLSNTAMALHTLMEMGLGNSEPAARGFEYLLKMRQENGTWEENPKIKPLDPQFWDMPGDYLTTIWLTADIADILLRAGRNVPSETYDFLRKLQEASGRFKGYYHTTWIALSLFGKNGNYDKKVFSGALAYLETVDIADWDASCIAWCLDCMNHGNVNEKSILRARLMDMLSDSQEPEGCWPSEGGETMKIRDANSVLAAVMDIMQK
ncbi:MAG: hypothetical protein R6W91_01160 [Thermoplasmata archaeon]